MRLRAPLSRYLVSPPFAAATPAVAAELKDFFEGWGPCRSATATIEPLSDEHSAAALCLKLETTSVPALSFLFMPRLHKGL